MKSWLNWGASGGSLRGADRKDQNPNSQIQQTAVCLT